MELRPDPDVHRHPSTDLFELASSDYVDGAELAELARSEYPWVVRAVAANERTPVEILRSLVPASVQGEHDNDVARLLLRNPALPTDLVGRVVLALMSVFDPHHHDANFAAVVGAFARADAPDENLLEVLRHPSATKHFRVEVAKVVVSPRVRLAMAEDRSSRVREALHDAARD